MEKRKRPLLTDDYLDEIAEEINQQFGEPKNEPAEDEGLKGGNHI